MRRWLDKTSLEWQELPKPGAPGEILRQKSFDPTPVRSSRFPELFLKLPDSHKYKYYVGLCTDVGWRVPVASGFLPREPDVDAPPQVRGYHALTLMLLFRPRRLMQDFVMEIVGGDVASLSEDDAWRRVADEYLRWRQHDIDAVAAPYQRRDKAMLHPFPEFDSKVWWACMISQKLRNYNAARARHLHEGSQEPRDLSHLPEYEACVPASEFRTTGACLGSEGEGASSDSESDKSCPSDAGASKQPPKILCKSSRSDAPPSLLCGHMLEGFTVDSFHAPPQHVHARNLEGQYLLDFSERVRHALPLVENLYDRLAIVTSIDIPVDDALQAATQQKSFFKRVDKYELLHADADTFPSRAPNDPFNVRLSEAQTRLCESPHVPSSTVVMEAAFFLLAQGFLNIPDTGTINVKQARAFLWNAAWLQSHMTAKWVAEDKLPDDVLDASSHSFEGYCLAIMGPGGTGQKLQC